MEKGSYSTMGTALPSGVNKEETKRPMPYYASCSLGPYAGGLKIRWRSSKGKLARLLTFAVHPAQYLFPLCGLVPSVDCRIA